MCSRIIVSVSFCLINLGPIYGQFAEAEKDTLIINEYQPEKQKIKLNEATMRAIKSGTLINFDGPKQANKPRPFVSKIPITKDFGLKPVARIPMEASDSIKIPPRVFHELTFNYLPEKEIRAFMRSTISSNLSDRIENVLFVVGADFLRPAPSLFPPAPIIIFQFQTLPTF